jgi:hypothetical protein
LSTKEKENDMDILQPIGAFEIEEILESLNSRPPKPMNTRTRKTAWKERRRLANAPKSIQKRVLKRR